jgi:cysteinyl-tRNA synthetase
MNLNHLGEQIDIHGGGNDLVFPHHENEIAQTESLTGKTFARYWIHNGMLQLSGEKMSKSLGNLVTITEFLAQHEADALRMTLLNSSYRSPLTYNDDVVDQSERALERLRSAMRPASATVETAAPEVIQSLLRQITAVCSSFIEAMDDDFNTAGALGCLFDFVRAINQARDAGVGQENLIRAQETLAELAGILGLSMQRQAPEGGEAAPFVDLLIEIRKELRVNKLWALSDLVRNRLLEMGVVLEDTKEGTVWRWK